MMKIWQLCAAVGLAGVVSGVVSAATLEVDSGKSRLSVDVKATGHAFAGWGPREFSISIRGDTGALAPQAVELKWNFKDLLTGEDERDHKMLDWLEHPKFGTGVFTCRASAEAKDGTRWRGNLKFHGVSKTIQFPVKTTRSGKDHDDEQLVRIDHQDFDLDKTKVVLTVDPVVTVRFNLVGT